MKLIRKTRSTPSQAVRKLTPRQPVPRDFRGRIAHFARVLRYFPLALAAGLLLLFLAASFYRYVAHSRYFSLEVINVTGNERLSDGNILALLSEKAGVELGSSTLRIDKSGVAGVLEGTPEIREAIVEKRWPNGMNVYIVEHHAAGIYVSKNNSMVFDEVGYLFSAASARDFADEGLYIVTGLEETALERGHHIPSEAFAQITGYRRVFQASSPSLARKIGEMHSDGENGLTLVMADGKRFVCGHRPPEETGPVIETILNDPSLSARIDTANLFSDLYISITPIGIEPGWQVSQAK